MNKSGVKYDFLTGLLEWESGGLDEVPTELIVEYFKKAASELLNRGYEEMHDLFNELD